jgi:predicted lipoprotein with Yx(FWY)xxD motif
LRDRVHVKGVLALAFAASALSGASIGHAADPPSETVQLGPQRGSHVVGTAVVAAEGAGTVVRVSVKGLAPRVRVVAKVRSGTCSSLGAASGLIASGRSDARGRFRARRAVTFHGAPVAYDGIADGEHVITIAGRSRVVACGIVGTAAPPLPPPPPPPAPLPPITLTAQTSPYGTVLFNGNGFVLYGFTLDDRGPSACYGDCAAAWPPYVVDSEQALRAGTGVNQALLGVVKRDGGALQVTYDGWPLYYYVGDLAPLQISCQNAYVFGGRWLVISPDGTLVP